MTAKQEAVIVSLTVGNLSSLSDVLRWAELAESIGMPTSSTVDVSAVNASIKVTAWLAQTGPAEEPGCHDVLCVLGEHEADTKHYDGKDVW